MKREPADLLSSEALDIMKELSDTFDTMRLERLLGRGFLLSQALDKWLARSIWIVSRTDDEYPVRIKSRLKDSAPSILYGCGDPVILSTGGLAIVGSRKVDEELVEYTRSVGWLAARSNRTVVSGGARGIDQSAMGGALEAGGQVIGVLSENLIRSVLSRELREYLVNNQLVLVSPYDPSASFNVGNAMNRNKLIYALGDAALVVSSDFQKGGTWTGAVEQLDKMHYVPVYVRSAGEIGKGLKALRDRGAISWPEPQSPDELSEVFNIKTKLFSEYDEMDSAADETGQGLFVAEEQTAFDESSKQTGANEKSTGQEGPTFSKMKEVILKMEMPKTETEVAAELQASKKQTKEWLTRLVNEGFLIKKQNPVRYYKQVETQRNFLSDI